MLHKIYQPEKLHSMKFSCWDEVVYFLNNGSYGSTRVEHGTVAKSSVIYFYVTGLNILGDWYTSYIYGSRFLCHCIYTRKYTYNKSILHLKRAQL